MKIDRDYCTTTDRLAGFITGLNTSDIPASAMEMTGRCVLDAISAALAGFRTSAAESIRRFGNAFFPAGPAGIWLSDQKASPAGAAMINAAAAAGGWLRGLKKDILAQALAISGIYAPLQSASAYSNMEHHTKEGIPWATLTGLAALDLAASGYRGPLDVLDHMDHFNAAKILHGLGETWAIQHTYFKPYSCCRWLHAPIECLLDLMNQHNLKADQIISAKFIPSSGL